MKNLILGLLGGGVVVQLLNFMVSARPNRRRLTAEALDSEITALEHTLQVLSDNIELTDRRHHLESEKMKLEIERLEKRVEELSKTIENLREENLKLRAMHHKPADSLSKPESDSHLSISPS